MSSPSESNQVISPKHMEKFALPFHEEYHRRLKEIGIRRFGIHICGDQNLNLPLLAEASPWPHPSVLSFGHEVDLSETPGLDASQKARTKSRPPRCSACGSRTHRPDQGPSSAMLPRLRQPIETLPADTHPLYRRHSRKYSAAGHRTCHPSRLVSALPQACRAGGARRFAKRYTGQPGAGNVGLVALWTGQYSQPDRRDLQLSFADEADPGGGW